MANVASIAHADDGRVCDMAGTEVTVEDLYRVPEDGKAEIVDGELAHMTASGGLHGYAAGLISEACSNMPGARNAAWSAG